MRRAGLDPVKHIANDLGVEYVGYYVNKPIRVNVRNEKYTIYSNHGASSSSTPGGKLNAIMKPRDIADADLYLMGHMHDTMYYRQQIITATGPRRIKHYLLCGHYVDYGGYAQIKNYTIGWGGTPEITLSGSEHNIKVNF